MSGRSSCPECGTILRIRDRSFAGRRVNCPECKTALRVELAGQDEGFVTRRLTDAELNPVQKGHPPAVGEKEVEKSSVALIRAYLMRWINSPLTAAWLLAIAILSLIAVMALAPKSRPAANRNSSSRTESEPTAPPEKSLEHSANPHDVPVEIKPDPPEPPSVDARPTVAISALEPANLNGPLTWPPVFQPAAPVPEPRPPVDVESKMSFKFPQYKQSKPVSRRELLATLQEQLGADILYDSDNLGTADLEKTVTFELENTTIGGVIKTVADAANWEITIIDTGLKLTRKGTR